MKVLEKKTLKEVSGGYSGSKAGSNSYGGKRDTGGHTSNHGK